MKIIICAYREEDENKNWLSVGIKKGCKLFNICFEISKKMRVVRRTETFIIKKHSHKIERLEKSSWMNVLKLSDKFR
jgi:hypothetical protein